MTDNVVSLGTVTKLDLPVDRVLEEAKKSLDGGGVVVIGWDRDGEPFCASSIADGGEVLWPLELTKVRLMKIGLHE